MNSKSPYPISYLFTRALSPSQLEQPSGRYLRPNIQSFLLARDSGALYSVFKRIGLSISHHISVPEQGDDAGIVGVDGAAPRTNQNSRPCFAGWFFKDNFYSKAV